MYPTSTTRAPRASAASSTFTMPTYTSHTTRQSPTKATVSAATASTKPSSSYSESDQNLLAMLTSTVACLKEKHMDMEALGCLEQKLWLQRRMFGGDSVAVRRALHEVVLSYNSLAMQFLSLAQFDQCLAMLRKAEAITGSFPHCHALQILTFNNLGCCYRKLGKLKSALKYLQEAASVGAGATHVKNLSITHLNLCAIQSQLGRHDLALEHAQAAIFHTQQELVDMDQPSSSSPAVGGGEDGGGDVLDAKSREEKMVSLAVAYHNLAVELEFNGRGEASLQWYKKALQLVAKYEASNQALYESFTKIFSDAKRKYQGGKAEKPQWNQRRQPARPKSAHPSSSRGGGGGGGGERGDVSYSATVASQCYKPTKPSTAGLQYARGGGGASSPPARTRGGAVRQQPTAQRPSSANSSRRRPLSASASRPTVTVRGRREEEEKNTEENVLADTVETRWRQIEKDLFGGGEHRPSGDVAPPPRNRPGSAHSHRPQSARILDRGGPSRQGTTTTQRHPPVSYGTSVLLQEEDEDDCGIIDDDEDDDDDSGVDAAFREPPRRPIASARHRQVLHESRTSRGGGGEGMEEEHDEEGHPSETKSTVDLPRQRVNHLEYVRRMKKLAENIQEDLDASRGRSVSVQQRVVAEEEAEIQRRASVPQRRTANEPVVETPRSAAAAKLRERVELVRRESVSAAEEIDSAHPPQNSSRGENTSMSPVLEVVKEDRYVYATKPTEVEKQLIKEASARCIQSAGRVYVARRRVKQRRQLREHETAARVIQHRARQFVVEAAERRTVEEERSRGENQNPSRDGDEEDDQSLDLIDRVGGEEEEEEEEEEVTAKGELEDGMTEDEDDSYTPVSTARTSRREEPSPPSSTPTTVPSTARTSPDSALSTSRSSYDSTPPSTRRATSPPPSSTVTPRVDPSPRPIEDALLHHAARCIQCAYRRHLVSQSITSRGFARRLSRSYIEHHHYNIVLSAAESHELAYLQALAATTIQALVRGRQTRLLYEAERIGRHAAASAIQYRARRFLAARQRAAAHGVLSLAARCIQRRYRTYASRVASQRWLEMEEEMVDVYHLAAATIQQRWREWWRSRMQRVAEWEAATCIQALGRGHLTRRSYTSLKESASKASAFSIEPATAEEEQERYDDGFENDGE